MFSRDFPFPEKFRDLTADDMTGGWAPVSPAFGLDGEDGEHDHILEWDDLSPPVWSDGEASVHGLEGFEPDCMALRVAGRTEGFYLDGQAWVAPGFRGRGLGTAMAASFIAWTGRLPSVEATGFTESGFATLEAAARTVRESFEESLRP